MILDAPKQNWQLYEKLRRRYLRPARDLSPSESFQIFQDLWSLTFGRMMSSEIKERIVQIHRQEKLAIRKKMVKAFKRLDEMENGRPGF